MMYVIDDKGKRHGVPRKVSAAGGEVLEKWIEKEKIKLPKPKAAEPTKGGDE